MQLRKKHPTFHALDWPYVILLGIILIFGLIMLASAGVSVGYEKYGDAHFFFKQQLLLGILPGVFLFVIISFVDYHFWQKLSKFCLLLSVILLVLVFIPALGFKYGGANRWLNIGGLFFQPSEVVKLLFLIFLANWLSEIKDKVSEFKQYFLPFVVLLAVIVGLILLQPDMGTSFMIVTIGVIIYFTAGGNIFYLSALSFLGTGIFFLLIRAEEYRMKRLTTFLHPELDPLGIGYHINQALLAIGSGGIFGRGYGLSRQKFMYLPEVINDSIFAIIAEELGFIFAVFLILVYLGFFWRGCKIASHAPDLFGKLLAVGISSWLVIQALVNIGAIAGLLPLTGIPLPFISYGRSSLIISLIAVGIVVNISKQTRKNRVV